LRSTPDQGGVDKGLSKMSEIVIKKNHPIQKGVINKLGKKLLKKAKKAQVVEIVGKGDYRNRPTSFTRLMGRGDYADDAGRWVGEKASGLLRSGVNKLKSIFGFGDYRSKGPKSNSLYQHIPGGVHQMKAAVYPNVSNPSSVNMGAAGVQFAGGPPKIRHREFVGSVVATGSSAFSTKVYPIQPGRSGLDTLFPWGCSVAACFEQYVLEGGIIEYHSCSSNYSSQVGLGSVSMSTIYDAESPPLSNIISVNNNEYTTCERPDVSFIHPLECAYNKESISVRYVKTTNTVGVTTDERFDDVGKFQVSLHGIPTSVAAGTELGQLWFTYDITFLKPLLPDIHVGTTFAAKFEGTGTSPGCFGDPTYVSYNSHNSLPCTLDFATGKLHLPVGYNGSFQVTLSFSANASDAIYNGLSILGWGSDIVVLDMFQPPAGSSTKYITAAYSDPGLPGGTSVLCFTFSTIGENADQNFIGFGGVTKAEVVMAQGSMIVTALDNDIGKFAALSDSEIELRLMKKEMEEIRRTLLSSSSSSSSSTSKEVATRIVKPERLIGIELNPGPAKEAQEPLLVQQVDDEILSNASSDSDDSLCEFDMLVAKCTDDLVSLCVSERSYDPFVCVQFVNSMYPEILDELEDHAPEMNYEAEVYSLISDVRYLLEVNGYFQELLLAQGVTLMSPETLASRYEKILEDSKERGIEYVCPSSIPSSFIRRVNRPTVIRPRRTFERVIPSKL
jgi:hypothetical protein